MDRTIKYFSSGINSKGHSPIYKMHKYFARRPHNVFRALIEHYSKENDIIFDPFGGGGVSLIEGLTSNRRVISCDINPIASFIQLCQTLPVDKDEFKAISSKIRLDAKERFDHWLSTECEHCHTDAHVRWFEHAYLVKCPSCNEITPLSSDRIYNDSSGKKKPGNYCCQNCHQNFRVSSLRRIGSSILNLRYLCTKCGKQSTKLPSQNDRDKFKYFQDEKAYLIKSLNLFIPEDNIPQFWDRQQEDCLHQKGFYQFQDLFTDRNKIISSYLFAALDKSKESLSENTYTFMLFTLSALLRYTNNMNFSTSSWMDGRPVAWAKHAYWTPNQFIEVNPIEYLDHRIDAALSGLDDQKQRFINKSYSLDLNNFLSERKDYCILNTDSSSIKLPDNQLVDLIITDPPYGSNVQYSELCAFWYVWIKDKIPFRFSSFSFENDAVVHRKTKSKYYSKSFESYNSKLQDIFELCYSILKPDGCLVFTFNNKNIEAWYSVIKAAIDSGFYIEPKAIIYQEPIDAYRDTAHQRFEGTPQGDYIYTFIKTTKQIEFSKLPDFNSCIQSTILHFVSIKESFSLDEFMIRVFANSTLTIIGKILAGESEKSILSLFDRNEIVSHLNNSPNLKQNGNAWYRKITSEIYELN